jgi:hypothetical protein
MTLIDTIELMKSADYKERFKAEYYQTKISYERLKDFNTRIEAAKRVRYSDSFSALKVEEPRHDCPSELLTEQQRIMGEYLHLLEIRAVIEGITLE